MTVPLSNLTATWNNGAAVFSAILMNVTDTGHANASALIDLQINSTSVFSVTTSNTGNKTNLILSGPGTARIAPGVNNLEFAFCPSANTNTGGVFYMDGNNNWVQVKSTGAYAWAANTTNTSSSSVDLRLFRDTAGILAQRNTTNAQSLRVYNTYTDASNWERGGFDWTTTANTFRIRSENLGTGTNRVIAIDAFAKAGAAANTDIPDGTWALVRDTSGSTTKLCYNNGGTLQTVALT